MGKFMVYVPDDLYDRAQERKAQLNFSELFRRALSNELQRIEQNQEDIPDLGTRITQEQRAKMLERFRQEKKKLQIDSFTGGYDAGIEWAKKSQYGQLVVYSRFAPKWDALPEDVRESLITEIVSLLEAIDEESFSDGWFKAVRMFRLWVDDQIPSNG